MDEAGPELSRSIRLPIDLMGGDAKSFLDLVRTKFHLGSINDLEIDGSEFKNQQTFVYLKFMEEIRIDDPELGEMNGVYVAHPGNITLVFNAEGHLVEYEIERPSVDTSAALKEEIKDLMTQNGIYVAKIGEPIIPTDLPLGQNFVMSMDNQGKKTLQRVRFG